MKPIIHSLLLLLLASNLGIAIPGPATAQNTLQDFIHFLGEQGCALGPNTRADATAAGFSPDEVASYLETLRAKGDVSQIGQWELLPSKTCKIRPPKITSQYTTSSPEILRHVTAIDDFEKEFDDYGCLFKAQDFKADLMQNLYITEEEATKAYFRFAATSVIKGEVSFFSPSELKTPAGFTVLTGPCADISDIQSIKRNNAFIIEQFDALVRALGYEQTCLGETHVNSDKFREVYQDLNPGPEANKWAFLEIVMIAIAANWIEDGYIARGRPRPPICQNNQ